MPCVLLAEHITPVVQDRLKLWHICQTILTCSGSGEPELQRWARYLPVGETGRALLWRCIETRRSLLPAIPRFFIVARGPVPRDLHWPVMFLGPTDLKRTRNVFSGARTLARDRPSPYGDVPFFPGARGPRMPHAHPRGFPPRR